MRSPGRPEPSRAVQREFWRLISTGITTVEAALEVGVSWPVGARWFRHAGGMPPISLDEPSGRYLSFAEREEIALLQAQGKGVREIGRSIARITAGNFRLLQRLVIQIDRILRINDLTAITSDVVDAARSTLVTGAMKRRESSATKR